ncbi:hypothetical protein N9414_08093 [Nodularia spumigena CCY9414]|nr:hypothetical protein N9414_08093 [Nodularia spumigena CCY9414]
MSNNVKVPRVLNKATNFTQTPVEEVGEFPKDKEIDCAISPSK